MIKKFYILLIIFILGSFAKPSMTYACGMSAAKTEKSCCKKKNAELNKKNDCCKNDKTSSHKNDDGCSGKCKNPSCKCPLVHFSYILTFFTEVKTKPFFAESERSKFYDKKTYISSGFYSIWTPPNIG